MILRACNPIFQHDICTEELYTCFILNNYFCCVPGLLLIGRGLYVTDVSIFDGECTGMQVLNDNLNRTNIENSLIGSRLAGPGMVVSVWL